MAYAVSSVILHAKENDLPKVINKLQQIQGVEIQGKDTKKIVITVEYNTKASSISERLTQISNIKGVLSFSLAYSYDDNIAKELND